MVSSSASLDNWREYFRGASTDIFEIIEHAIMVAVSDCPNEFKLKRDRIAEMMFTCKMRRCFGCDGIELALPNADDGVEKSDDKNKSGIETGGSKDTKESETGSRRDDDDRNEFTGMNVNRGSNYSYGDAEALADEIELESRLIEEVLRLKRIIDNSEEESTEDLFDSLRKLQLMPLSVENLKVTDIGKSVNALRKHRSNDIRKLVKILIEYWKTMVDAYVIATAAIAGEEAETDTLKDVEEEEGLPSPPMDEGIYLTTTTPEELAQFFDGMDDYGNPRNSGEFNKNRHNGRKPNLEKRDTPRQKLNISDDFRTLPKDRNAEQKRNQDDMVKQAPPRKPNRPPSNELGPERRKSSSGQSGLGRPKPAVQQKTTNEFTVQQKHEKGSVQKKPAPPQQEMKLKRNNEASDGMNLEAAKRKLQERYQEAENAKKQRTIQVVELRDITKKNGAPRNQNMRAGNHNRPFSNGRR